MHSKQRAPAQSSGMWQGLKRCGLALALTGVLTACSTTGKSFDTSRLSQFVPGQTTLDEAIALLNADPENIYRERSGAAMARWAHKTSVVTDAVYFRRELWLQFDQYGRFERVVNQVNVGSNVSEPEESTSVAAKPRVYPVAQSGAARASQTDVDPGRLPVSVPQGFPYSSESFHGPVEIHRVR